MKPKIENCQHQYAPLGMERISTDNKQIEVIVCVFCIKCSTFRTKILYFDRQKGKNEINEAK